MADLVAGVDGTKHGWVAVVLAGGRFLEARLLAGVDRRSTSSRTWRGSRSTSRSATAHARPTALARAVVGGSSVFAIPERERFDAPFAEGGGISAQAHALGPRIRHVTELASRDPRFREVHPEVCFTAMNGMRRLKHRKKSAGGAFERLALLRKHGLNIDPGTLGTAATVPLDDLLDAAACAWTAARRGCRVAAGSAGAPSRALGRDRRAVWPGRAWRWIPGARCASTPARASLRS